MKTIKIFLFISIQLVCCMTYAQSYNTELNTLGQYVQRMYMNEPFEGAKVISDVDKCYLVCLVAESATANEYATQRKAEVKAMHYANEYLNGTQISSNTIVYTKETSDGYSYEEIEDFIAKLNKMKNPADKIDALTKKWNPPKTIAINIKIRRAFIFGTSANCKRTTK